MSWTKKQIVQKTFSKIGYAAYIYDLMPEQMNDVLQSLDLMIAEWNVFGILIGYPLPINPDASDMDVDSGIPTGYNSAVINNLAIRIAPDYGKTVSDDLKRAAKAGYNALLNNAVMPNPMQLPGTMPLGAGNKYWRNSSSPFVLRPTVPVDIAGGDTIDGLDS